MIRGLKPNEREGKEGRLGRKILRLKDNPKKALSQE